MFSTLRSATSVGPIFVCAARNRAWVSLPRLFLNNKKQVVEIGVEGYMGLLVLFTIVGAFILKLREFACGHQKEAGSGQTSDRSCCCLWWWWLSHVVCVCCLPSIAHTSLHLLACVGGASAGVTQDLFLQP